MKIRHPFLIKLVGLFGSWLVRIWIGTLAYRYRPVGPDMNPLREGFSGRYIYAFWHENILLPCYHYHRRDIKVLISDHADGEMIAQVCRHIGFGTVRGSKTRRGVKALREMIRSSKNFHIAVIPDGPRGPRRHLEPGMIYLAAFTGMPIVLMGVGYDRPWRLKTWDHFALPRPWSKALMITLPPITIPPDLSREQLEEHRLRIEKQLQEVTEQAEQMICG